MTTASYPPLWTPEVEPHVLDSLATIYDRLDTGDRLSLIRTILAGPTLPNDILAKLGPTFVDHVILTRLSALGSAALDNHPDAAERRRAILAKYPDWTDSLGKPVRTIRPHFEWKSLVKNVADDIAPRELVNLVLAEPTDNADDFRSLSGITVPKRASAIEHAKTVEGGSMAIPILLAGVGKDELTDSTSRRALLDALTGLPATTTAMACMSIATLLETMGEVLEASESPGFFLVWDSVIPHCLASEQAASSTGPPDHLLSSLNNPCGRVTAALLRLLARSPLSRDGGIASPFADRLKRVLHSSEPGAFYGRVLIASRLYLLSWLDLAWTESELIPFFSWSRSTEAVGAWQGFLWTPRMGNRLFHALRTDFVEAFSHLGELGDMGENLLGLLVALALDAPDRMAPAETRGCLRTIDTMARRRIAWLLAKRLQATEENKRSDLWLDRVDPWLQEHWPLETQYADGDTSDMLGWAATFTGNAFPRAVATIRRLLAPSHGSLMTLRALDENLLASQFPEDSLVLIDCLLDQSEERQHIGELGRLLDAIEEAQPSLASDERFRRLRNLARRHGRSRGR